MTEYCTSFNYIFNTFRKSGVCLANDIEPNELDLYSILNYRISFEQNYCWVTMMFLKSPTIIIIQIKILTISEKMLCMKL